MNESISNWKDLAQHLGSIGQNSESGGTDWAIKALDVILGEEFLKSAVDWCIGGEKGSELSRSVLRHVHSNVALEYCYSIYKTNPDNQIRENALDLLKVIGDHRVLPWLPEILTDPSDTFRTLGIHILDQLYFTHKSFGSEVKELAKMVENDPNKYIRKFAKHLLELIHYGDLRQEILEEAAKKDPKILSNGFDATEEEAV
jgi:hypothetical protein